MKSNKQKTKHSEIKQAEIRTQWIQTSRSQNKVKSNEPKPEYSLFTNTYCSRMPIAYEYLLLTNTCCSRIPISHEYLLLTFFVACAPPTHMPSIGIQIHIDNRYSWRGSGETHSYQIPIGNRYSNTHWYYIFAGGRGEQYLFVLAYLFTIGIRIPIDNASTPTATHQH